MAFTGGQNRRVTGRRRAARASIFALFVGGAIASLSSSPVGPVAGPTRQPRWGETGRRDAERPSPTTRRCGTGSACRDGPVTAGGPRHLLHHLPQPETPHRRACARQSGPRQAWRRRRRLGARDREASGRLDAAARKAAARRRDLSTRSRAGWRQEIDRAWAANPNPGRISAVHRLNRAEYNNAIRDLFALDLDVKSLLPGDETADGSFDNFADVLTISTAHLERYLSVARQVTRLATGLPPASPGARDVRDSAARACRTIGRARTCRSDRAAASRSPQLSGRRRVPDQGPAAAAVSGLHHGHGLAAAARRPPRRQAAEAIHRRRRSARARPAAASYAGDGEPGFAGDPEWEKYMQTDRRRRARGPRAGRGGTARRRRLVRPGAVGAGRPSAAAAARPGPDERPGLHGLRERRRRSRSAGRIGIDGAGEGHAEPSRDLRLRAAARGRRARLRDEDPVEDRAAGLSPAGDERGCADAARVLRRRPARRRQLRRRHPVRARTDARRSGLPAARPAGSARQAGEPRQRRIV